MTKSTLFALKIVWCDVLHPSYLLTRVLDISNSIGHVQKSCLHKLYVSPRWASLHSVKVCDDFNSVNQVQMSFKNFRQQEGPVQVLNWSSGPLSPKDAEAVKPFFAIDSEQIQHSIIFPEHLRVLFLVLLRRAVWVCPSETLKLVSINAS